MDKILIYTNDLLEIGNISKIYNALVKDNFEIAFATDNLTVLKFLTVNKMLVVKFGTYYADFYVSNTKLKDLKTLTIKELEGLI